MCVNTMEKKRRGIWEEKFVKYQNQMFTYCVLDNISEEIF